MATKKAAKSKSSAKAVKKAAKRAKPAKKAITQSAKLALRNKDAKRTDSQLASSKKEAPKKASVTSSAPRPKAHTHSKDKKKVIQTFAMHEKDTGSAPVQVAILTSRIDALQSHLKDHPKDNHSRKGLLQMVGKRRKHLDYLKDRKPDEYEKLIKDLGLRK